jgi:hypothetical protein
MTVVFIGSKRAYVSFQQQYGTASRVQHIVRFDQLQGMGEVMVMYEKAERNSPTWRELIDLALGVKRSPSHRDGNVLWREVTANPYTRDEYFDKHQRIKNLTIGGESLPKPICLWCGKAFQTDSERDSHEEVCGE